TIAEELGIKELARELGVRPRPRIPKPVRPGVRRTMTKAGTVRPQRRTTKNADHQTVPRFEQLVDLGFLEKPKYGETSAARKRWKYKPTQAAHRWAVARKQATSAGEPFLWEDFARTCLAAAGSEASKLRKTPSSVVARYLWRSYVHVR